MCVCVRVCVCVCVCVYSTNTIKGQKGKKVYGHVEDETKNKNRRNGGSSCHC